MKNKLSLIVSIITVSIFLIMTVGYAAYGAHMNITGSTTFKANGEIAITNAVLASYSNLTNPQDPVFDKESITFDVTFNVENIWLSCVPNVLNSIPLGASGTSAISLYLFNPVFK